MDGATAIIAAVAIVGLVALLLLRLTIGHRLPRLPPRDRARRSVAIGVGGAGSNAIDAMVRAKIRGVDFIACNTDAQALRRSRARTRIRIGRRVTQGLGAGGDPVIGRQAADEDAPRIGRVLRGADLVFVAAGLGGGTGSGAAPRIAEIARGVGAVVVAVVTLPFGFEGRRRADVAAAAAAELAATTDTSITIANDRLHTVAPDSASLLEAFGVADEVLCRAVGAIADIIAVPGLVNLDFADVRAILSDGGPAVVGVGRAGGEDRAGEATRLALASPLLEPDVRGARAVLFHIAGPPDLQLAEVRRAAELIRASADEQVDVVFGASVERRMRDEVRVTIVATGLAGARRTAVEAVPEPDPGPERPSGVGDEASAPTAVEVAEPDPPAEPIVDPSGEPDQPTRAVEAGADRPSDDPLLDVPTFIRADRRRRSSGPDDTGGAAPTR